MVQKPEALYITAPSPMLHTTGRSGAPSCAPTAAPMPCPSEAPKLRTRRHWRLSKPNGIRWSALRKLSETTSVPSGSARARHVREVVRVNRPIGRVPHGLVVQLAHPLPPRDRSAAAASLEMR